MASLQILQNMRISFLQLSIDLASWVVLDIKNGVSHDLQIHYYSWVVYFVRLFYLLFFYFVQMGCLVTPGCTQSLLTSAMRIIYQSSGDHIRYQGVNLVG